MTVSERLKKIRINENLSQTDFAEKLNVSRSTLMLVEQGKREINAKILESLKKIFNVSADWMLFGEETEKTDDLKSLIDDFNKADFIDTILYTYVNSWCKPFVLYTAKYGQFEFANTLNAKISEADKYLNRIIRLSGNVNTEIADYTINPNSEIADKIKSSIRHYFKTVYEFLDFLSRYTLLNDFGDDMWEVILSQVEDHLNSITNEVEKETEELLKNSK